MVRLYFLSLGLIVTAAVMLGLLWVSVDQVLAEGRFLWTYVAMALGIGLVVMAGFLGALFQRLEHHAHNGAQ
jgi:O-antigen/teichoic acid export membrane protein